MRTLRSPAALAQAGLIPQAEVAALERVAARYAVAVTPDVAGLIETAEDGIGRQFVPRLEELDARPGERADPIGDDAHAPLPGIVHRYPDRVLLKPLHVCPVYCRFCFRREVVGPDGLGSLADTELDAALAYIAARPEIWEVVVTGGDPLMLSPRRLGRIAEALGATAHVKVMRLHSGCRWSIPAGSTTRSSARSRRSGARCSWRSMPTTPGVLRPAPGPGRIARLFDAGIPQ